MKKVMQRRDGNYSLGAAPRYWECLLCPPRTQVFHFLDVCLAHLETKHEIAISQVNLKDGFISTVLKEPQMPKGE